jgi:transposase
MRILYERCAAVDVGKDVIAVAVRLPGDGPDGRQMIKRTFKTFYGVLREAARWLTSLGVTHVAMEATGIYSMPVYHALIEHGDFTQVLVCNAGHVKNVPGRKTDLADAEWLVHLLECGLLAGSFIPPADIKAARDVIRYRAKVVQSRTSEVQRLGNVLQDAGIKIDSVASSIATKSGLAMIEALIDGERRPAALAGLAKGRMRSKIPDLSMALEGRFGDHHALMCRLHLDHIGHLEAMIAKLDEQIEAMMEPFRAQRELLKTIPGIGPLAAAAVISEIGADVREYFPDAAHLASWAGLCPGNHESAWQTPFRPAPPRQHPPPAGPGRIRLGGGPPPGIPQGSLPPARDEMGRLPQPYREEKGHHRGRARPHRHHLACTGHRQALRRTRRGLLHHPAGPRTRNTPPDRKARSPRPHRQPPASRLTPAQEPGSANAPPGAAACPAGAHSRIRSWRLR